MTLPSPFPATPAANELPAPPRALLRGTMVDRFEILRVIADAASHLEYVAFDQTEHREVVLKEYMPQRLGRRKGELLRPLTAGASVALSLGLRSFIDEGRMLASVEHPSLVRVLGMIEANNTAYMVMPLYDGLRLQHARQAMSVPPDERLLRPLIDGLLGALEAMHAKGLVHGAVSPSNVLLLSDERAVLLGPDLARHVIADDLVESLMTAVEPSFEAPEQLAPAPSKPLGPWTDLYSLAETLRFCISAELRTPHQAPGERRESMPHMVRRLFGDPPSATYTAGLLETMDAALDVRAAARPQSVARFRELLGPLPEGPETAVSRAAAPESAGASSPAAATPPIRGRTEPDFDAMLAEPTLAPRARSHDPADAPIHLAQRPPRHPGLGWAAALVVLVLAAVIGWGWRLGWWEDLLDRAGVHVAAPGATNGAPPATDTPSSDGPAATTAAPAAGTSTGDSATPATGATPSADAPSVTPAPAPATDATPTTAATAPPANPAPTPAAAPAPAPAPVAPRPETRATATPERGTARTVFQNPRDACDGKTEFALYRCMQLQCEQRVWLHHPQCELMRTTDKVPPP